MQESKPKPIDEFGRLLMLYRTCRSEMQESVAKLFPPGSRVQPIGTTTGNWGATVRDIDTYHRRDLSADMVFLDWDNGNKFAVRVDEIELIKSPRKATV